MASKPDEAEALEQDIIYITEEGKRKLEEELHRLLSKDLKRVLNEIRESRKFGEFVEDSDYDDARKEQALIEGRIAEIHQILRMTQVIDKRKVPTNKVGIGCIVDLRDVKSKKKATYQIVGPFEADPLEGKISYDSPLGQALCGKTVGSEIEVRVPAGVLRYKVERITK